MEKPNRKNRMRSSYNQLSKEQLIEIIIKLRKTITRRNQQLRGKVLDG
jgi:hypothetical protein